LSHSTDFFFPSIVVDWKLWTIFKSLVDRELLDGNKRILITSNPAFQSSLDVGPLATLKNTLKNQDMNLILKVKQTVE